MHLFVNPATPFVLMGLVIILLISFVAVAVMHTTEYKKRMAAEFHAGVFLKFSKLFLGFFQNKLLVKKLHPEAILPTVANPGEDLGYDLYALEDTVLKPGVQTKVRTGVAAHQPGFGLLVRDRSSMAAKGVAVTAGVIDAGYRGELLVVLNNIKQPRLTVNNFGMFFGPGIRQTDEDIHIKKGDKVAQVLPVPVLTGAVEHVEELPESQRGEKGFGSSGR